MSTQADADRNLLFGTLAVQMGFISRDQLADAMAEWARDRARPVGDILRQKNVLAEDELRLLEAMVAKHLVRHDGDVARSLAAVSPDPSIREALSQATDQMGQTSLAHGPPPKPKPPVGATDVDAGANPGAVTTTSRAPSALTATSKRPFASVWVSPATLPAICTRTVASATDAPDASSTLPLRVSTDCAAASVAVQRRATTTLPASRITALRRLSGPMVHVLQEFSS